MIMALRASEECPVDVHSVEPVTGGITSTNSRENKTDLLQNAERRIW